MKYPTNNQVTPPLWNPDGAPMVVDNADLHVMLVMSKQHGKSINEVVARSRSIETEAIALSVTLAAINKRMGK